MGRDRPDENREILPAAFDEKSVEIFYLLGKKSTSLTHFFPLALFTYHILPPPDTLQIEMGEERKTNKATVHLYFGDEINLENNLQIADKTKKRKQKTKIIFNTVNTLYKQAQEP